MSQYLNPRDREANRIAGELREHIHAWMQRRGVTGTLVIVTPFVDPSGQPNVLVRMNGHLASAMVLSFTEEHAEFMTRYANGTYRRTP